MASSRTTSGPSDLEQFYELQNLSGQLLSTQASIFGDHVMDAMAGTSTVTTTSPTSPSSPGDSSPFSSNLNPEGRVSRPARRRSRASRRTPTTLVNTDPSNFRAMVQQLTGGPAAAYTADPRYQLPGDGNFSFGFGINHQRMEPAPVDAQQQQQQQQETQAHQQQQLQFQQNMFNSMNRNHDGSLP